MPSNVIQTPHFKSRPKKLARKFPSVLAEADSLVEKTLEGKRPGDFCGGAELKVYRTRIRNQSGSSGKSGGFRITYCVDDEANIVVLMTRSQRKDSVYLSDYEIRQLLKDAGF